MRIDDRGNQTVVAMEPSHEPKTIIVEVNATMDALLNIDRLVPSVYEQLEKIDCMADYCEILSITGNNN